ncbi:DUF4222 domain-containing protein [Citrobacter portucalensis]|uniref:DUF4222 domain-containing protein n=1 Tax=Citrobacter portucalensis TaxID=1639133 RepID=UPI00226B63E9|nr:DUF4222 domain-containing protein [Citrobacter portucalensis]MCX9019064.1 DUF4222 domain-containing protein [Citrobacter portucalensis]
MTEKTFREVPAPGSKWKEKAGVLVVVTLATHSKVEFQRPGLPVSVLPFRLFYARFELVEPAPASYVMPSPATGYRPPADIADHPLMQKVAALRVQMRMVAKCDKMSHNHPVTVSTVLLNSK